MSQLGDNAPRPVDADPADPAGPAPGAPDFFVPPLSRSASRAPSVSSSGDPMSVDYRPGGGMAASAPAPVTHSHTFNNFTKSLKLPVFDGKGDVVNWLFEAQDQLALIGHDWTDPQVNAWIASHLDGAAKAFYVSWRMGTLLPDQTYKNLLASLHREYADSTAGTLARDQVYQLQQTGRVQGYTSAFRRLVVRCSPPMSDTEMSETYIRGLKPNVRREVILKRALAPGSARSFIDVVALAMAIDAAQTLAFGSSSAPRSSGKHAQATASGYGSGSGSGSGSGAGHRLNAVPDRRKPKRAIPSDAPPCPGKQEEYYFNFGKVEKPEANKDQQWWYKLVDDNGQPLCFFCKRYGHYKGDCRKNPHKTN